MPFGNDVNTECNWDDLEEQVRNKVNEIAQDAGRKSHGAVTLDNGTNCQHWRAGDYRIFGSYDLQTNTFNFIGWGQHVGRGNNKYKVNLCDGSSTRATTD